MKISASILLSAAAFALLMVAAIAAGSICDNAPCEDAINVTTGENFTIVLASNTGSTGYEWWTRFDTDYLSLFELSEQAGIGKQGMVGVPGQTIFVFSAKKPGSTHVIMLRLRPWKGSSIEESKIFPINII